MMSGLKPNTESPMKISPGSGGLKRTKSLPSMSLSASPTPNQKSYTPPLSPLSLKAADAEKEISKLKSDVIEKLTLELAAEVANHDMLKGKLGKDEKAVALLTVRHVLREVAYLLSLFAPKDNAAKLNKEVKSTWIYYERSFPFTLLYMAELLEEKLGYYSNSLQHVTRSKVNKKLEKPDAKINLKVKNLLTESEELQRKLRDKKEDVKLSQPDSPHSEDSHNSTDSSTKENSSLGEKKHIQESSSSAMMKPNSAILLICYSSPREALSGNTLIRVVENLREQGIEDVGLLFGQYDNVFEPQSTMEQQAKVAQQGIGKLNAWKKVNESFLKTANLKEYTHETFANAPSFATAFENVGSMLQLKSFKEAVTRDCLEYLGRNVNKHFQKKSKDQKQIKPMSVKPSPTKVSEPVEKPLSIPGTQDGVKPKPVVDAKVVDVIARNNMTILSSMAEAKQPSRTSFVTAPLESLPYTTTTMNLLHNNPYAVAAIDALSTKVLFCSEVSYERYTGAILALLRGLEEQKKADMTSTAAMQKDMKQVVQSPQLAASHGAKTATASEAPTAARVDITAASCAMFPSARPRPPSGSKETHHAQSVIKVLV